MSFDALRYLEILKRHGFSEEQAKGQVQVVQEVVDSDLATKHDAELIRKEIKLLEFKLKLYMGTLLLGGLGILVTFAKFGWLSIK